MDISAVLEGAKMEQVRGIYLRGLEGTPITHNNEPLRIFILDDAELLG
jgi:hypothetical protein